MYESWSGYGLIGFYFKVSNTRKGKTVAFHIVNFVPSREVAPGSPSKDRSTTAA